MLRTFLLGGHLALESLELLCHSFVIVRACSVCACVLALVLGWMCHLVPAACKDVSSSVRWPLYKLMYFTRVYCYFK